MSFRCAPDNRNLLPSVLYDQPQIVLCSESNGCLDILDRSGVDTNYRYATLSTRRPKGRIEVTCVDSAVREDVRLVVDVLHRTALVRPPVSIEPSLDCGGAFR